MSEKAGGWSVAKARDRPNRVYLNVWSWILNTVSVIQEVYGLCGASFRTKKTPFLEISLTQLGYGKFRTLRSQPRTLEQYKCKYSVDFGFGFSMTEKAGGYSWAIFLNLTGMWRSLGQEIAGWISSGLRTRVILTSHVSTVKKNCRTYIHVYLAKIQFQFRIAIKKVLPESNSPHRERSNHTKIIKIHWEKRFQASFSLANLLNCLLYTSDAADE